MRRLALTLVAASVLLGGTSLAIAQTPAAGPTYFSDYYKVPYYKSAPSMAEMAKILIAAGYSNPTDLALSGEVWTGTATMENHPVKIRFDRQGIWQTTK